MPSQRILTAQRFISYFASLDKSIFEPLLAEDYYHEFVPAALHLPGPFDRAGFLAHTSGLNKLMTGFSVFAKEYTESDTGNQVVVWATSKTQFREEVKDDGIAREEWEHGGEYVFMFTMDESGEKVVKTIEFLDSAATMKLLLLVKRARENLAKREKA
ncbi:hypothetical protein BDW62DRAFT_200090 [Aspergillus aurantiobrunneus]